MDNGLLFTTLALVTLLGACKTVSGPASPANPVPPTAPGSALGDAPTLQGTIANFAQGDFSGKTLEIYAGIEQTADGALSPDEAIVRTSVTTDGSFTLQLPGEGDVLPHLVETSDFGFGGSGCEITTTPEKVKATVIELGLYADGEMVEGNLIYTDANQGSQVFLTYTDRDATSKGSCSGESMLAGMQIDLDLRKGWNTVLLAPPTLRTVALDSSYQWYIPFCTLGCPPENPEPEPLPEPEPQPEPEIKVMASPGGPVPWAVRYDVSAANLPNGDDDAPIYWTVSCQNDYGTVEVDEDTAFCFHMAQNEAVKVQAIGVDGNVFLEKTLTANVEASTGIAFEGRWRYGQADDDTETTLNAGSPEHGQLQDTSTARGYEVLGGEDTSEVVSGYLAADIGANRSERVTLT